MKERRNKNLNEGDFVRKLFAGAWVGEWGWELFCWQSHVRAVAKNYDYVVCASQPSSRFLYEYADEFIDFPADTTESNQWYNNKYKEKVNKLITKYDRDGFTILNPLEVWPRVHAKNGHNFEKSLTALDPQEFIKFGAKQDRYKYDILYHARFRNDWDTGFRNWDREHCIATLRPFMKDGCRVGCIGTKLASMYCGGEDLRDTPLDILADICASSKMIISPVSGALHFGMLCGTNAVSWATKLDHKTRVEQKWNPFDCKTIILHHRDQYWKNREPYHPQVKELQEAIRVFI